MVRYQIRLPEKMTLDELVGELSLKAWMMIEGNLDFSHPVQVSCSDLKNRMISVFMERISTFDLCGVVVVCAKGIEGMPLLDQPEFQVQPEDSIFLLTVQNEILEFVNELSIVALESVKEVLRPQRELGVFQILRKFFRAALADYIYFNPQCGVAHICPAAEKTNACGQIDRKLLN